MDVIGRKSAMSNDDRLRGGTCDGRLTFELSIFAPAGFPTLNPSYDEAGLKATETMQGFKKSSNQLCKNVLVQKIWEVVRCSSISQLQSNKELRTPLRT
jgi:hypothetical protein